VNIKTALSGVFSKASFRTAVASCCQVHVLNSDAHMPICGAAMLL